MKVELVTDSPPDPPLSELSMAPPSQPAESELKVEPVMVTVPVPSALSALSMAPPSQAAMRFVNVLDNTVMVPPGPVSPLSMPPPLPVAVLLALAKVMPETVRYPGPVMVKMAPEQSGAPTGVSQGVAIPPPSPSRIGAVARPGAAWMTRGVAEAVWVRSTAQLPV